MNVREFDWNGDVPLAGVFLSARRHRRESHEIKCESTIAALLERHFLNTIILLAFSFKTLHFPAIVTDILSSFVAMFTQVYSLPIERGTISAGNRDTRAIFPQNRGRTRSTAIGILPSRFYAPIVRLEIRLTS